MAREFTDADLQWQPIIQEPMGRNFEPNQFASTSPTYSPYYGYYNPILPNGVVANGGGVYGSPLGPRVNETPYYLNSSVPTIKNTDNTSISSPTIKDNTELFTSIPALLPTANPMVLLFLIIILVMLAYIHSCQMVILHEIRELRSERPRVT